MSDPSHRRPVGALCLRILLSASVLRNATAGWNGASSNITTVGSAGPPSESFYGTSDQSGNVWEYTEAVGFVDPGFGRECRGGNVSEGNTQLKSSNKFYLEPFDLDADIGFRVASPAGDIPAASDWGLAVMGLLTLAVGTVVQIKSRVQTA